MTLPVFVEQMNGRFTATLAGAPGVSGVAATRSGAIAALQAEIDRRMQAGEIVTIEIQPRGVSHLAGQYAGDPMLRQICDDAYAARDAERTG